jgi:isopenicillin N synthase-like dioxygenase
MSNSNHHDNSLSGSLGNSIPGIDAALFTGSAAQRAEAASQIRAACVGTGFFCIDNLLDQSAKHRQLLDEMRHFFALADEDPGKQAVNVTNKENTNGWMPMFQEPAYQPGTLAHVESFDCGHERLDERQSGHAVNRWPDIPGFRENVLNARDELTDIGTAILKALAEAMLLDGSFFADRCNSHELSTMRLLNYPASTDDIDMNANVGIAAHTDFECITLLSQTAPGLELMDREGNWVDAPASDDRLIVLLGDMIERWTNGLLKATSHRVRCRDWQRFSVVLFFGVNDDVVVVPQGQFISDDRPARFSPIGQNDHSREQLRAAEENRQDLATA